MMKSKKSNSFLKFTFLASMIFISPFYVMGQIKYCYDADGNRTMRLQVGNSCRHSNPSDTNKKDSVATKIENQYGIGVSPNPTMSSINVNVSNLQTRDEAIVYLFDTKGNTLFHAKTSILPLHINMESYASGVYFVKVVINNKDNLFYRVVKSQ